MAGARYRQDPARFVGASGRPLNLDQSHEGRGVVRHALQVMAEYPPRGLSVLGNDVRAGEQSHRLAIASLNERRQQRADPGGTLLGVRRRLLPATGVLQQGRTWHNSTSGPAAHPDELLGQIRA